MHALIIICAKYLIIVSVLCFIFSAVTVASQKRLTFFIVSAGSLLSAYIIAKIFSHIFTSPRPFVIEHVKPLISHAADNGFPSDHTLLSMTLAAIVSYYNKRLGIAMGVISLIIGFSRVAAHVHHTIDIIGAALIGIVVVLCVERIYQKLQIIRHKSNTR